MCATCHVETDPEFPTQLKLGKKCKDCHAAVENAPVDWRIDGDPPVRISAVKVIFGPDEASEKIRTDLEWMLEDRGFTLAEDIEVDCITIEAAIEVFRVREDRFVRAGEQVMQATVTVELKAAGSGALLLRRRAVSRPEYHSDPEEAGTMAARDALTILAAPIAEALKKALESSGGDKK